jgi:hypothetical protein
MIDTAVILFSTGMCLFIVVRAIRLDSTQPWFGVRRSRRYDGRPEGKGDVP